MGNGKNLCRPDSETKESLKGNFGLWLERHQRSGQCRQCRFLRHRDSGTLNFSGHLTVGPTHRRGFLNTLDPNRIHSNPIDIAGGFLQVAVSGAPARDHAPANGCAAGAPDTALRLVSTDPLDAHWITSCLPTNRPESSELPRIGRQKRWENPRPSFSLGPPRFGGIPENGISRLTVQC